MSRRTRWVNLDIIVWVILAAKEAQAAERALDRAYTKLALLSVSDDINAASFRSEKNKIHAILFALAVRHIAAYWQPIFG